MVVTTDRKIVGVIE